MILKQGTGCYTTLPLAIIVMTGLKQSANRSCLIVADIQIFFYPPLFFIFFLFSFLFFDLETLELGAMVE